jgi:hypothetical protein
MRKSRFTWLMACLASALVGFFTGTRSQMNVGKAESTPTTLAPTVWVVTADDGEKPVPAFRFYEERGRVTRIEAGMATSDRQWIDQLPVPAAAQLIVDDGVHVVFDVTDGRGASAVTTRVRLKPDRRPLSSALWIEMLDDQYQPAGMLVPVRR